MGGFREDYSGLVDLSERSTILGPRSGIVRAFVQVKMCGIHMDPSPFPAPHGFCTGTVDNLFADGWSRAWRLQKIGRCGTAMRSGGAVWCTSRHFGPRKGAVRSAVDREFRKYRRTEYRHPRF